MASYGSGIPFLLGTVSAMCFISFCDVQCVEGPVGEEAQGSLSVCSVTWLDSKHWPCAHSTQLQGTLLTAPLLDMLPFHACISYLAYHENVLAVLTVNAVVFVSMYSLSPQSSEGYWLLADLCRFLGSFILVWGR